MIAFDEPTESAEVKQKRDAYFVPIERLRLEKELFARLHAQRYTFAAYFGHDKAKPFDLISNIHNKIITAASVLIEITMDHETRKMRQDDAPLLKQIGWGPRPDEFDESIDKAVEDMDRLCRPILETKLTGTRDG